MIERHQSATVGVRPVDGAHATTVRHPGLVAGLLTATTMIGFTSQAMVAPLLIDLAATFDVSVATAAQLATATSLLWALGAPVGGPLVDRYGRRPLLLTGLTLNAIATALGALSPTFAILFATRMLSGVAGTFIGPSVLTTAGEVFPPDRRGTYLGWVLSGFSLALVVGAPAMALVGGWFGWRWSFAVMAALLGLLVVVHSVALPSIPRSGAAGRGALGNYRAVLGDRRALMILAMNVCERTSYGAVTIYLASFLMQRYGLSTAEVAPVLPVVALGGLVGTWTGGRLSDRLSPISLVIVCQAVAGVAGVPLMFISPALGFSVALGAWFGLSNAGSRASVMGLAAQVTTQARGTMMGLMAMTNHVGLVVAATVGGLLITLGGYPALSVLCGASALLAAVCGLRLRSWER